MHQVYDDEMTFKLVSAASAVSGLPVELCLEEFGKHFLVYCQKNGYDQILRVLGSNLYDFLTNLDNLHDHLASIYPGMRAPSFRVTRLINTNRPQNAPQKEPVRHSPMPADSMYLHYYSERMGLSPIVKGLVMAVAREFFQTQISVEVCANQLEASHQDDHVVLKIGRAPGEGCNPAARAAAENQSQWQQQQMLNIYDSLSANAHDSMVSAETMMQTFPFHVIFDRSFRLVQVGKSLLRLTSQYWRQHQDKQVKFDHLFRIVRPKIEFTFDAIADHTNQVFVVRTRPLVLNADRRRRVDWGEARRPSPPAVRPQCPMERLARQRRSVQQVEQQHVEQHHVEQQHQEPLDELGEPVNHVSLRLKGQMIVLLGGQLCLYLCSPRVDHLGQLLDCGVWMSDFALHDRARELMLMSHTHKEDRETVKKLDQASNDLKKMDTKLRQENKRTEEVLHNIFPAKIATLLSHGHKIESESFELVTCLYSDIIGFTKMCGAENVRPIDIVRLLNTMYLQFDNLTNIHGVFKVETIGDAYVVVGGLPEPAEDHADRCVKMGLDMVKVISSVRSPADKQPIQMRIGIHSGPVMAGIVGIRVPRYSLFGNTTTLANQLETHGVGGKIHISEFTLSNLIRRDRFLVEDNPNQIANFPFVTYFVTSYLGDQGETLKHERQLEEQLLKDLELMGNAELELVDESQVSSAPEPASSLADRLVSRQDLQLNPDADGRTDDAGLLLMDLEESQAAAKLGRQLTSSILAEALEQVEEVRPVTPVELSDGPLAEMLLVRPRTGPKPRSPPTDSGGRVCEVCAGSGRLGANIELTRLELLGGESEEPTTPERRLLHWLRTQLAGLRDNDPREASLELLLEELREERRLLQRELDRAAHPDSIESSAKLEMQRFKRMDTLKCHKLKRRQLDEEPRREEGRAPDPPIAEEEEARRPETDESPRTEEEREQDGPSTSSTTANYLRSSLAAIKQELRMGAAVAISSAQEPEQPPKRHRKRFSLSRPFAALASQLQQSPIRRRAARSQSGGAASPSGGRQHLHHQEVGATQSTGGGGGCSCLRSSASGQSLAPAL